MLGGEKDVAPITMSGDRLIDTLAFNVRSALDQSYDLMEIIKEEGQTQCNHCNRIGHTCDTYQGTHGKLAKWKPKKELDKLSKGFSSFSRKENGGELSMQSLSE